MNREIIRILAGFGMIVGLLLITAESFYKKGIRDEKMNSSKEINNLIYDLKMCEDENSSIRSLKDSQVIIIP